MASHDTNLVVAGVNQNIYEMTWPKSEGRSAKAASPTASPPCRSIWSTPMRWASGARGAESHRP